MRQLETERLILRPWRREDFDDYAAFCADEEAARHLGGTKSREEAFRHMCWIVGHWEMLGFGHFAIEQRDTGRWIGRVGFLQPEGWPGFELGWSLARHAWGSGFATEAARECLRHAFEDLDRERVISIIAPANVRSQAVAERLGSTRGESTVVLGHDVEIWSIDRDRWLSSSTRPS